MHDVTRTHPAIRLGMILQTLLRALWRQWSAPPLARASRVLVLAGAAALFLEAAGTFEVVFTVRAAYVLLVAACIAGAPYIVIGWRLLPTWLGWLAAGLVLSYLAALAVGHPASLSDHGRGTSYRGVVYLFDLVLGMGVVGLIAGLWRRPDELRPIILALVAGAVLAAVYGIYQWAALRFHLPLQDVNNAVNSDGITYGGARSQGPGPLGGQRIRSTFVEPHFLATFLVSAIPLALVIRQRGRWRWAAGTAVLLMGFALLLTGSVPAIAILVWAGALALTVAWVARRRLRLASVSGALLVLGVVLTVGVLVSPSGFSAVTGRKPRDLAGATAFRVDAWNQAIDIWSERPITGYGPGQGPIKLARRAVAPRGGGPTPVVLGTASGLWSAALLDGGVLALSFWILVFGGLLYAGGRAALRRGDVLLAGLLAAATAAILGSMIEGDRLDLRVWVLLGCLAAASRQAQSDGPGSGR
jgi:O-antigen ligase